MAAEKEAAARQISAAEADAAAEGRKATAAAVAEAEGRGMREVQALESRIAAREAELEVCVPFFYPPLPSPSLAFPTLFLSSAQSEGWSYNDQVAFSLSLWIGRVRLLDGVCPA